MSDRTLTYDRALLQGTPPAEGPLTFTASTTRLNKHGFSLRTEGWRLDDFNANPVMLWMHMPFRPPIGRAPATNKGDRIVAEVTFDAGDEFAAQIESKYRRGFLNAVSVGLDFVDQEGQPLDTWRMSGDDLRDNAFYDLAEISAVTTPADPGALIENQRAALSRIGRELVELFDEQEHGTATAAALRAAVHAELERLGLDVVAMTAIGAHSTATEDSSWDGPAAVSAMPANAATLRYCHAWRDPAGDPEAKATYKFPHHRTKGGPANLAGCRNGLARLPGAHIPEEEKAAVERHLRNHLGSQSGEGEQGRKPIDDHAARSILAAFTLKESRA